MITINKNITEDKLEKIKKWPIWEKDISRFPYYYDHTEECYIIEGRITIETEDGIYHIEPGDFVRFEKGLSCIWDIKEKVRKYYDFPK
jgi:uncharacterized cupin superfamily protein